MSGRRRFALRVIVRLGRDVNDPQGNTIGGGLHALGHADVADVRVGRVVDLTLEADDETAARARGERLCADLLANPVIETFEVEVREVVPA